jgi:hypothetical protein
VVGCKKGDREEQWLGRGRALLDQLHGFPGEDVGLIIARILVEGPTVGVQRAVLVERVAPHPVGRVVDGAVPVAPARRDVGRRLGAVAVEVLAQVGRVVAGPLKPDGQRFEGVEASVAAGGRVQPQHLVVVGVLAAQIGGSRGTAKRIGDVEAVEGHAARAEEGLRARHGVQVGDGLVVGHQHDHVRTICGSGRGRAGQQRHEDADEQGHSH